jgi:adenine-specific DNA-methyltransferase
MIVNYIYETTLNYVKSVSKNVRKNIGQFFTPPSVANYMAGLMEHNQNTVKLLDTGAGTGILIGALCQRIINNPLIRNVIVDLYENSTDIVPLLRENMEYIKNVLEEHGKTLHYEIIQENFILHNADYWADKEIRSQSALYDVIISNPPYKKMKKSAEESTAMNSIVYGQPNIYFFFMAMSAKLLKHGGEMIFITPRSFTSGAYFKEFRRYFLRTVRLRHLHLFNSRNDVFDSDKVLQEALILKAVRTTEETRSVIVSSSNDMYFTESTIHEVAYSTIVDLNSDSFFIMIPTNKDEIDLISTMKSWGYNLPSLGFKLKTGPVVDFRATEFLRDTEEVNTVPLLYATHFSNGFIQFPVGQSKFSQYILDAIESKGILLANRDYVLVKRFTSKEEKRRIQCALFFSESFMVEKIGIENHLNYVTKIRGEFTKEEMYGIFALLNSSFMDTYYRILNGSTQVNATEVNSIPLPSLETIKQIGTQIINMDVISNDDCDNIIQSFFDRENQMAV